MTRVPIQIPPGVIVDDTTFSVGQAAWADMNNCRFWRGQPQVIGGWQRLVTTALTGVCRSAFSWSDNLGNLNVAFGTNTNLQLWIGGTLFDITPAGGGLVGVNVLGGGSGYSSPTVSFSGGGGTGATATAAESGGVITGITITNPGTGYTSAPTVNISGGTGAVVVATVGFVAGNINGTGGSGYGTGTYGTGDWGEPSEGSFFPLTWSLAPWGQNLMACPRGQTIFQWTNATGTPAQPLDGAPANVTVMLVTNTRQVMAFGCNDAETGVFNPRLIRFSDIEDPTDWTATVTNNAGDFVLPGSGQIIGAQLIGNYVFVWTDNELFQGAFDPTQNATTGEVNGWDFVLVGEGCGLIGPNAAVVLADQIAYWFGSNGQFHLCPLGGAPQIVPCPMQEDVFANVAASQQAKIVASSCAQYGEIRFDYPDARDGVENSRYIAYSTGGNISAVASYNTINTIWSKGVMVRTAYVDAGPSPYPIGVDYTGDIYYHECGQSADGAPFDAYAETADFYLGAADNTFTIRSIWPDVQAQQGALSVSLFTRLYPQDAMVRTRGPFALSPGQSKKDFLADGRIARIRYESNSAPTFWRLGKPTLDVIQRGLR